MSDSGQVQTVPQDSLEKKVGRKLQVGERFATQTGYWKVLRIGDRTYTVERIG